MHFLPPPTVVIAVIILGTPLTAVKLLAVGSSVDSLGLKVLTLTQLSSGFLCEIWFWSSCSVGACQSFFVFSILLLWHAPPSAVLPQWHLVLVFLFLLGHFPGELSVHINLRWIQVHT